MCGWSQGRESISELELRRATSVSAVGAAVADNAPDGGAVAALRIQLAWRGAWPLCRSQLLFIERASLVVSRAVVRGTVLLTSSQLFFVADGAVGADGSGGRACLPEHSTAAAHGYAQHRMLRQRRWTLASVCDVLLRRFLMRRSAVELLLVTGRTVLLHFETRGDVSSTTPSDARRDVDGGTSTADGDGGGGGGAYTPAHLGSRTTALVIRSRSHWGT